MSYDFASYNAPQSAVLDTLSINTDYLGGLMESHGPAHRAGQRRNGLAMYPAPYNYPTFSGMHHNPAHMGMLNNISGGDVALVAGIASLAASQLLKLKKQQKNAAMYAGIAGILFGLSRRYM